MRLDYAQFLELEMFTRFGGMPDTRVRERLARGARIRAIFDQSQHAPLRLADEVALILALQAGMLDALTPDAVAKFRADLAGALDRDAADAVRQIQETGDLDEAHKQALLTTLRAYAQRFARRSRRRESRNDGAARGRQRADFRRSPAREHSQRDARHRRRARAAGAEPGLGGRRLCRDDRAGDRTRPGASAAESDIVRRTASRPLLILFCAEQGFAGAFTEHVLDFARGELGKSKIYLIGSRGEAIASERGVAHGWKSSMPSHSSGVPKLADRIGEALFADIADGEIDRADIVFNQWRPAEGVHVERRRLFPLDLALFKTASEAPAPLTYLKPETLLAELTFAYMHAQLCNAALHAFAAENEARMEAMARAHGEVERNLNSLLSTQRIVRQEEITAEIVELSAGVAATAGFASHSS